MNNNNEPHTIAGFKDDWYSGIINRYANSTMQVSILAGFCILSQSIDDHTAELKLLREALSTNIRTPDSVAS